MVTHVIENRLRNAGITENFLGRVRDSAWIGSKSSQFLRLKQRQPPVRQ